MIRPSKAVITGAAVAGLLTGSFAVRAYAASTMTPNAGVSLQTMADAEKGEVTHMPKIPYVAPRTDVQSVMPQQPPSQP